jgi:3'-5' exonuclease
MSNVIIWDIETVPDLKGFAAANRHVGKSDDEVRAITRSSVLGRWLRTEKTSVAGLWMRSGHRTHVGERSEKELIASFVDRIAAISPQLVTFNGSSFDLPVQRYRAMVHDVAACRFCCKSPKLPGDYFPP